MKLIEAMCGGCGYDKFKVELSPSRTLLEVHLTCLSCKSTSIVKPSTPKLEIDWGKDATGIVCPK